MGSKLQSIAQMQYTMRLGYLFAYLQSWGEKDERYIFAKAKVAEAEQGLLAWGSSDTIMNDPRYTHGIRNEIIAS